MDARGLPSGRSYPMKTRSRFERKPWSEIDRTVLRELYTEYTAEECAAAMERTVRSVVGQVKALGLRKSREWIAARARERTLRPGHGSRVGRFRPGLTPWNKGQRFDPGGRSAQTRFRSGERSGRAAELHKPVGYEVVREGQLWRKVTDEHRNAHSRFNFKPVSVIVWESANGPVPAGHIVRFRDGMATTVAAEITLDRLELVTRAENMRRNSIHNYPAPVAGLIRAVKRAEKALRERT